MVQKSFVRYFIIGVASFAIDFILFNIFIYLLHVEPIPANMTSLLLSMVFNFIMSNFWTFKVGKEKMRRKIARYLVIAAINYVLNNIILYVFLTYMSLHPVIAKVFVMGLQITWTFLIYKLWVFKPAPLVEERSNG
ncbi:MAG: GtrA family protein [Candidatus Dojkabacteria bacterium]